MSTDITKFGYTENICHLQKNFIHGLVMISIILLYALFGSSFPLSKTLLAYTNPIFLTGIRMFLAGTSLLLYHRFYAREPFNLKIKNIKYYAQIVIFGIYLTYILRFWGLSYLSSSKTAFLFNIMPFFSAFYSYLAFKEKLSKKQWIGLIIGFLGFIPILVTSSTSEVKLGEFFFISLPELAVLAAVACQSYSWILMRKLIREKSYAPTLINGTTMTIGGILALMTTYFLYLWNPQFGLGDIAKNPYFFTQQLFLVIFISNIVCHNMYAHLLRTYTATFLAFAGFLGPLFATFYGWLFLSEKITWHFFSSAIIVFFGLYLFYKDELAMVGIEQELN